MALMGSRFLALLVVYLIFSTCALAHKVSCPPPPEPIPKCPPVTPPVTPPAKPTKCPVDTLKLGVCGELLGGLVNVVIGTPPTSPCCALLTGLVDAEVGLCLCTAIKANVLGIVKLDIPVALSLLVNACGKTLPDGFECP